MADIKQVKTPDGVTHDIRDDSKVPLEGSCFANIEFTEGSTILLNTGTFMTDDSYGIIHNNTITCYGDYFSIGSATDNTKGCYIESYDNYIESYNNVMDFYGAGVYFDDTSVITLESIQNSAGTTITLPSVTADNNGQILKVVNGAWSTALESTTIPVASSTAVGGIKTGYTASGKNYPVVLDGDGKAYVNVPWTDTNTDTNTWRPVKVNNTNLLTDSTSALNFSTAGFATVSGSSGTVTFDTKIRKVASVAEATDTSCVYLVPSSNGNLQQSYIIASSAPADTTKIWVDSANSNIAKVWSGSAWSTLGSVWS